MARRTMIGELRHRVSMQSSTESADAYGQDVRTWSTYATVWAMVEMSPGSEIQLGLSQQALAPYRVTIRYRGDVLPSHRIVYGAKILEVMSVSDLTGYGTHEVITCVESIPGAVTTTTTTAGA
jgi:SPP1 family predicted phage head-tail adaptor